INQLRSYLRPLEVIASLSPLLGLFGTVLGMILAFQQMELAGSQIDPSVLSGG
ncbi:MAG TPA: MotA/TolQ/ExbB proton channel family protein, partial [Methylophaga sp.]|nr:MotA/TolQ/ExbB proton channel family protein [Methylophaga sp.]